MGHKQEQRKRELYAEQQAQQNLSGLSQNYMSESTQPGTWQPGYSGVGGIQQGYQSGADRYNTTYNNPSGGGQWTQTSSGFGGDRGTPGAWTSASGEQINDLPGYMRSRNLQKQGSDFSGYQQSMNDLLRDPSKIQETAGYQFNLDQGNQAINRSAAARGMLGSGNVLAELAKYGQGMASTEYGGQVDRLSNLMQGAQQFGVQSGYYQPPQRFAPGTQIKPSTW